MDLDSLSTRHQCVANRLVNSQEMKKALGYQLTLQNRVYEAGVGVKGNFE